MSSQAGEKSSLMYPRVTAWPLLWFIAKATSSMVAPQSFCATVPPSVSKSICRKPLILWHAHALTDLAKPCIHICIETVTCCHTRMKVEQVWVVFVSLVFLKQRQKNRLNTHFNVSLITSYLACLRPAVTDASVLIVFFPQIVEVYSIDACKTQYHLCNITS